MLKGPSGLELEWELGAGGLELEGGSWELGAGSWERWEREREDQRGDRTFEKSHDHDDQPLDSISMFWQLAASHSAPSLSKHQAKRTPSCCCSLSLPLLRPAAATSGRG